MLLPQNIKTICDNVGKSQYNRSHESTCKNIGSVLTTMIKRDLSRNSEFDIVLKYRITYNYI